MAVSPVSPTSATQTINTGIGSLANNYETFLKLLTTQLKNQDPLSPLDTNEFTQQLTAMTGVQQQLLTNQLLTQMISQDQASMGGAAVNLIGKTVTIEDPAVTLSAGKADFDYTLARGAASAKLDVLDAQGRTVWSGSASDLTVGEHKFSWNGKDIGNRQLPDGGAYTLRVTAADASGKALGSTVTATGLASSVQTQGGVTYVSIGPAKAPFSAVTSVTAPAAPAS